MKAYSTFCSCKSTSQRKDAHNCSGIGSRNLIDAYNSFVQYKLPCEPTNSCIIFSIMFFIQIDVQCVYKGPSVISQIPAALSDAT